MDKETLKRRVQRAAALLKEIDLVWNSLNEVPSFSGKARFMDKVKRAQTYAHNLHWDLERDLAAD